MLMCFSVVVVVCTVRGRCEYLCASHCVELKPSLLVSLLTAGGALAGLLHLGVTLRFPS